MNVKPRWVRNRQRHDGIQCYTLASWEYYEDFIKAELDGSLDYVYRGQHSAAWKLKASLDRSTQDSRHVRYEILERFRKRIAKHPSVKDSPRFSGYTREDWMALAQHYGEQTPFLDFSESPLVSLFFAFESVSPSADGHRAVWALSRLAVQARPFNPKAPIPRVEIGHWERVSWEVIRATYIGNPRLRRQQGVLVRAPANRSLENWVGWRFKGDDVAVLVKIRIPDRNQVGCMAWLREKGVDRAYLFPDIGD